MKRIVLKVRIPKTIPNVKITHHNENIVEINFSMSQTSFSLYLYNQWTDFHKPSCAGKPQMRAICTYVGGTKVTTND